MRSHLASAVLRRQLLLPTLEAGWALSGDGSDGGDGGGSGEEPETRLAIRRLRQTDPSAVRHGCLPLTLGALESSCGMAQRTFVAACRGNRPCQSQGATAAGGRGCQEGPTASAECGDAFSAHRRCWMSSEPVGMRKSWACTRWHDLTAGQSLVNIHSQQESAQWAPLVFSECQEWMPDSYAPCIAGRADVETNLETAEELVYKDFALREPSFLNDHQKRLWRVRRHALTLIAICHKYGTTAVHAAATDTPPEAGVADVQPGPAPLSSVCLQHAAPPRLQLQRQARRCSMRPLLAAGPL